MPTNEKLKENISLIAWQHPLIQDIWETRDSLKIRVNEAPDELAQS
jgi:hypothetical protein